MPKTVEDLIFQKLEELSGDVKEIRGHVETQIGDLRKEIQKNILKVAKLEWRMGLKVTLISILAGTLPTGLAYLMWIWRTKQ